MHRQPTSRIRSSTCHVLGLWLFGIALLGGMFLVGWQLLKACQVDLRELLAGFETLRNMEMKKCELRRRLAFRHHRAHLKSGVVAHLQTGRYSLREAVERYRELVCDDEVFQIQLATDYRHNPPTEVISRLLICYAFDAWLSAEAEGPAKEQHLPGELEPFAESRILNIAFNWGVIPPTADDRPGLGDLPGWVDGQGEWSTAQAFSVLESER